jgi:hypothetical protein
MPEVIALCRIGMRNLLIWMAKARLEARVREPERLKRAPKGVAGLTFGHIRFSEHQAKARARSIPRQPGNKKAPLPGAAAFSRAPAVLQRSSLPDLAHKGGTPCTPRSLQRYNG